MELWIGTSGYVYPEWDGVLYPRGASSGKMLSVYAEIFPLVELNFSYYQMPTAEQLARMGRRVTPGFQFIVKAHRSLTHEPDAGQIGVFSASLAPLRRDGQLANVLCQFPQRFHRNEDNRRWISTVQDGLDGAALAVEFRHQSWDRREVNDWLRHRKIVLVSVDVPDLASLFPRKLVRTGREIYLRLHSRRASTWHGEGADRYDYAYSDQEMQEWIDALAENAQEIERALILFNNCRHAHAVTNACRLSELVSQQPGCFRVVRPAPASLTQGSLFSHEGISP